jgi:hypothetical protein
MTLNDEQRKKVSQWIGEGHKLSEIQKQLETEFGLRMTYLDVRLLVDDLKLTPKDPAPVAPKEVAKPAETPAEPTVPSAEAASGKVSVTVDELARTGSLVSGKVTFSDGNHATWYLDQTGRLGVAPDVQGYKPPQQDIVDFQTILQAELAKIGF